ncbi:hypothetical protein QQM39_39645 [Streptomyces sp. DT2A-34]|uniref:hypothetical protein n=1 Tax=Streptomyces sp. DT2A-34 TaxID=3051182 RepID=UPI00265C3D2E|nr:hypothetical protein [Streptomyces sp. DT2A-34]MDO0916715.1 hypothetical protein [Streptomyces sp. DT2A-34]
MGLGATLTVVVSVLIAVTLLPAVLGLEGRRIATSTAPVLRRSAQRTQRRLAAGGRPSLGLRWATVTARRKWLVVVACVLGLGHGPPATDLQLGLGGGPDPNSSAGRAQKFIDKGFGPGYSGTLTVLAQGENKTTTLTAVNDLAAQVKELPGVASVSSPLPTASGQAVLVSVTPSSGPDRRPPRTC